MSKLTYLQGLTMNNLNNKDNRTLKLLENVESIAYNEQELKGYICILIHDNDDVELDYNVCDDRMIPAAIKYLIEYIDNKTK